MTNTNSPLLRMCGVRYKSLRIRRITSNRWLQRSMPRIATDLCSAVADILRNNMLIRQDLTSFNLQLNFRSCGQVAKGRAVRMCARELKRAIAYNITRFVNIDIYKD